jgi:hypothetical protein
MVTYKLTNLVNNMKLKHLAIAIFCIGITIPTTVKAATTNAPVNKTNAAPAVEGWYFRAVSGYPAAIAFEPVALLKNGDYVDVGDEPLELLNIAADKKARPTAWGTWKKTGATFYLTDNKGHVADYKLGSGNWFPAYAYTGTIKLKKGYEKVSGGDYGNGTHALIINKINFVDATHFTEGANGGVTSHGSSAWKKSSNAGTYKIYGNTIELIYADKTVKKSFALGATGSPARPTNTIIFIGGDAYTDTE